MKPKYENVETVPHVIRQGRWPTINHVRSIPYPTYGIRQRIFNQRCKQKASPSHSPFLLLRWCYNPMQTFATLMDFSQSAPLFDLSFQSLILNLLIPVCTQFRHLFLVVHMRHTGAKFVAHLLSDDHKQNRLSVCKAPQDRVKKGRNFFSKVIIVHTGENPAKGTKIRRYRRQIIFPMDADVFGKEYVPYNGKLEDFCPIRAEDITS